VALVTMRGMGHELPPTTYQNRASKWIKNRTP